MNLTLCGECLGKYRALVFNPAARPALCHVPFDSVVWPDEHPSSREMLFYGHDACLLFLIGLFSVRKKVWRAGGVPAEEAEFWRKAQVLLPDWPGFRRLSLTVEERAWLQSCAEETASMMDDLRNDSAVFAVEQKPGGAVRFVAHPRGAARPGDETTGKPR